MDINYELYKVFYYVAKTLSFSDASKRLYISQSAVCQSIKALEKKLLVISAGSDVLRIVPPLVITKADIDEMAEILDECLA